MTDKRFSFFFVWRNGPESLVPTVLWGRPWDESNHVEKTPMILYVKIEQHKKILQDPVWIHRSFNKHLEFQTINDEFG